MDMNILLLFFALPVATIILAVVLQRLLKSPILVALTFFAIYLIVTFAAFDETFLVFAIVYTILAFIAAVIAKFITRIIRCQRCCINNNDGNDNNNNDTESDNDNNDNNSDEDNTNCCTFSDRNMNYYRSYRTYGRRY